MNNSSFHHYKSLIFNSHTTKYGTIYFLGNKQSIVKYYSHYNNKMCLVIKETLKLFVWCTRCKLSHNGRRPFPNPSIKNERLQKLFSITISEYTCIWHHTLFLRIFQFSTMDRQTVMNIIFGGKESHRTSKVINLQSMKMMKVSWIFKSFLRLLKLVSKNKTNL